MIVADDLSTRYLLLFSSFGKQKIFNHTKQQFFSNLRKVFRIHKDKKELREIIDDVLGIVDAGYAEVFCIRYTFII